MGAEREKAGPVRWARVEGWRGGVWGGRFRVRDCVWEEKVREGGMMERRSRREEMGCIILGF